MNRIIDRDFPDAHRENLIVLDGTTGQNALAQAREFGEAAELTGVILTKMDGTAKGGIAVAIQSELNVPVKYIGVGETIEDLQKFDADEFVNALFDIKSEEAQKEAEQEPEDIILNELTTEESISDEQVLEELYSAEEEKETPFVEESLAEETDTEDDTQKTKKKKWFFWK